MFDTPQPGRTLRTLFGALVFVLGAQSIRFLFGSLAWYLRDTVGIGVIDLVPIALAPFVAALLIPILARWLTVRGGLWVGLWLLALARTFNQISTDPAIDLWTSAVGTMAFVGLLPLMLSMGRSALVGGFLLGIAIDSAIRGMNLSLDLAYQVGIGSLATVIALGLAALYVLWACPPIERRGVGRGVGLVMMGLGPWLFFQMLILQNQGWTSEVAGMGGPQTQLRIALLNVVALIAVAWLERSRAAAVAALVVLVVTVMVAEGQPLLFNVLTLVAIPAAGLVWAAMVPEPEEPKIGASTVYLAAGMTLFVIIGLLYYIPLDLNLGFDQQQARIGVAVLLALFGIGGLLLLPATRPGVSPQAWAFAALAALLPLFGFFVAWRSAETVDAQTEPLRVMTYNIHSSFNIEGQMSVEDIAQVIEDSGASVIGLQEVPRGRLISGVSDQLTLLQDLLGFEHVAFFGTTDPTWGNAVLSRFPITDVERVDLPKVGTPMQRGYLGTTLRVGDRQVLFVSTHLQHVNDRDVHDQDPEADLYPVHQEQIGTIIDAWKGREPAILVGDFNARPDWRQTQELEDAGWVDAWADAGEGDGFTSNSRNPRYRIDYIFYTPDLKAVDAGVIQSQASDHFPVVADVGAR